MKSLEALRVLDGITAYQWGMVTSAQAGRLGVGRLELSRFADAGLLEGLMHGVYKDAGSPGDDHDHVRAAWLSTSPRHFAHERVALQADAVVVAGASAARLHGIGDLWDDHVDFVVPVRRQSQRPGIRYRRRRLVADDVMQIGGLPVLTVEATVADLVDVTGDLSLVADALRDAWSTGGVDETALRRCLSQSGARASSPQRAGGDAFDRLLELAGIDRGPCVRRLESASAVGIPAEPLRRQVSVG